MFENGWQGAGGFGIPQVMPGPSNPWASKSGGSGGGGTSGGGSGSSKPQLPAPRFPAPEEGSFRWPTLDEILIGGGMIIMIEGISLVGLGLAALAAAAAGAGAPVALVALGYFAIIMGGLAIGFGAVALLAGIDPPVRNYAETVRPRPMRLVNPPKGATPAMEKAMEVFARLETLGTAEVDIIYRARSAAEAGDAKAYDKQVRDLFAVQGHRQNALAEAAALFGEVAKDHADALADLDMSGRLFPPNLAAALTDHRDEIEAMGLSPSDLNNVMALMNTPSPVLECAMEELDKAQGKPRSGVDLLKQTETALGGLDMMTWEAFGGPPKRD